MSPRILVALDLGESSLDVLRAACALTEARKGVLSIVHVVPEPLMLVPGAPPLDAAALAEIESSVRRTLREQVTEPAGAADAPVSVERGEAYAEIVRRAEDWKADLVVVGSHGRTGLSRVLLGSVAERVVRYAHCPVLVVRPGGGARVVLVATDLSDPSLPAIARGAEEARRRGARLVVAHAVDATVPGYLQVVGAPFGAASAVPPPDVQAAARAALVELLQSSMERFGASGEALVVDGPPVAAIVHKVEELAPELLVIGTHGRTGLKRLALGSVAERLVGHAPCSVLVVRQHQ